MLEEGAGPELCGSVIASEMKVDLPKGGEPVLVMEREFSAPRDLVWAALTDPSQVKVWYGGHGFENPVCEMDVRPGGRWRHVMRTPDGAEYPAEYEFLEVVPPERPVWRTAGAAAGRGGPHDNTMTVTLTAAGRNFGGGHERIHFRRSGGSIPGCG
jgi:uncharacterized protein YndB with AHSA1/START domain